MKHPSNATLALYAGGDLSWPSRWRAARHLAGCERCRAEVDAYSDARAEAAELRELPRVSWNRLAAEMKANIRLGLEAGECVRAEEDVAVLPGPRWFRDSRALVACASIVALVVVGVLLERPGPRAVPAVEGAVLQAIGGGIEVTEGGQVFSLLHGRAQREEVTYSVGAQGSMRARYVDSDTGHVTINNVYAQ
jgi:hypothetical protein